MSQTGPEAKPEFGWTARIDSAPEKALVLAPQLAGGRTEAGNGSGPAAHRSAAARLGEAAGLARAIDLEVAGCELVTLRQLRPATLIGSGKVEEIAARIKADGIGLAIVDHPLTPGQQRNLEKAWNCKVLDRTGLILEIFGARAQTREGRLQVELASLTYQKSRLVRQWTHLERQRGGLGKTGGPGETQIEADRRLIQERVVKIEKELEKVARTRDLHRAKRKKAPVSIVAVVGYTNAGKSTLFNRLTGAGVLAKDMLFATLDPTLRRLALPQGTEIVLSDTVGFISDLPTMLIAAFRATLEEVIEADLILHVRDMADPDNGPQAADVYSVLKQIGIGNEGHGNVVEIWNKIDLLDQGARAALAMRQTEARDGPVLVSSVTGEGIPDLLAAIERQLSGSEGLVELTLKPEALGQLPRIYKQSRVIERRNGEDGSVWLKVRPSPAAYGEIKALAARQ